MLRAVDAVTSRSPCRKSTRHPSMSATRAVSSPVVSVALSPVTSTVTGCVSSVLSPKCGSRGSPPVWWAMVTPMTPGAGEKNRTVTRGRLRVSPRPLIWPVGAKTVKPRSSGSTDSTTPGRRTLTPGRSCQYPSVNFTSRLLP
jgi:hypothetical protein